MPLSIWVALLAREIGATFEGSLWAIPSRVYTAPLRVRVGSRMSRGLGPRAPRPRATTRRSRCLPRAPASTGRRAAPSRFPCASSRSPARAGPTAGPASRSATTGVLAIQELPSGRALRWIDLEPQPVASFYGENREERTILPLSAYPKTLIDAVLAAEDQRFYSHHGVDPLGIGRALFENVRSGEVVQGGSTITQQTVKNLYLTGERSLGRKLKEAVMALILDARYPKDRILEAYLNEVYLGQRGSAGICGFGEAARFYFGKEAGGLDLAESAMLAGIIRAPAWFNPIAHPDRALARKNVVVQQMLEQGRITRRRRRRRPPRPGPRSRRGRAPARGRATSWTRSGGAWRSPTRGSRWAAAG